MSFMAFIQKQSHQINWRLLEFVNKILWRFPLNLLLVMVETSCKKMSYLKILKNGGGGGRSPISTVDVILDNIASSFKVIPGN